MKTTNVEGFPKRGASIIKLLSRAVLVLAASLLATQRGAAQNLVWASSYCGISASALEEVEGVVVDRCGSVYATGLSGAKGIGSVIRTMKLGPKGNVLWNVTYSQPSLCGGMWGRSPIALDDAGNVIVVGAVFNGTMDNWSPILLKLSAENGALLGSAVCDLGPFASFDAVTVAGSDLYVLGHNNPNNGHPHVVHTLKMGVDGIIRRTSSFEPITFWGTRGGILATKFGVFTAAGGRVTAHDFAGNAAWARDLVMPNGGSALAEGPGGYVYLAIQNGMVELDPGISPGTRGEVFGAINGLSSQVSDLKLDAQGNIYLVGSTLASGGRGTDIITQKYDAGGNLVWSATHGKSGGYSDDGIGIAMNGGFIYVGGSKYNKNLDMCVVKYTGGE